MADVFRLTLERGDGSEATIHSNYAPSGQRSNRFQLPFDPALVPGLLKVLEKGDLSLVTPEARSGLEALGLVAGSRLLGPDACNRLVGQRLFESLFPVAGERDANIRGALEIALSTAPRTRKSLPLQLIFSPGAVQLALLPWELICDEAGHLVADGRARLSRYMAFGEATMPMPVANRLEVLVVSPRPSDTTELPQDAEPEAIRRAFAGLEDAGCVRLHQLKPATRDAFAQALDQRAFHVVHFDGHGGFGKRCPWCEAWSPAGAASCGQCGASLDGVSPEGLLAFEGVPGGISQRMPAAELGTLLRGRQTRLFVASACRSGRLGGASAFNSIGPRLIQAGVPAVVAMQFEVPADSAALFVKAFYSAIAGEDSIVAAAESGRRMLFASSTWHIPVVYLRSEDGEGKLFRQRDAARVRGAVMEGDARGTRVYLQPAGAPAPNWDALHPADADPYAGGRPYDLPDHAVFFGREEAVDWLAGKVETQRCLVLHGQRGSGKTSLVNAGLIPELLARRYLCLTVREYDDPIGLLCGAIRKTRQLDVRLEGAQDLAGLVSALVRDVGRPLLLVFDEFDELVAGDKASAREDFVRQFATCAASSYPLPVCLLAVLRSENLAGLQAFAARLPRIFDSLVPLGLISCEATAPGSSPAQRALNGPLERRRKAPQGFDETFVRGTLLPDLCVGGAGKAVHPVHLQLVADELFRRAKGAGKRTIGNDEYAEGSSAEILRRYLDRRLQDRFGRSERWENARLLLMAMVTSSGERVFLDAEALARRSGLAGEEADALTGVLLEDGLLEGREAPGGKALYSLAHHHLAQEVRRWMDPDVALERCARANLERAWDDWVDARATGGQELLAGSERLAELRRWRERASARDGAAIEPPQLCLLLRSAVSHRFDMDYWARELAGSPEALDLVRQVHDGPAASTPRGARQAVELGAEALGIGRPFVGQHGLARAAVAYGGGARRDGAVRHTAALALAALAEEQLGLNAVDETLGILRHAAPAGWRRTQALAQMKAAGFKLPERATGGARWVQVWAFGLALSEQLWSILAEAVAGGLGAAIGLSVCLLLSTLLLTSGDVSEVIRYAFRGFFLQPMGLILGILAVAGARIFSLAVRRGGVRHQALERVIGFGLGFMLGLVFLWLPIAVYFGLVTGGGPLPLADYVLTYVVGGAIWGLGIAIGLELCTRSPARRTLEWAFLGGGLGGAAASLLVMGLATAIALVPAFDGMEMRVPLVEESGSELARWLEAFLAGFGIGGGLTVGWELGRRLWRRLQPGG